MSLAHASPVVATRFAPAAARAALVFAGLAGACVAHLAASPQDYDSDLGRLLKLMALIKLALALSAGAAVAWRLGAGIGAAGLAAYAAAAAAMGAGVMLIWDLARIGAGAALLHAGLIATLALLYRDRAFVSRIASAATTRRS